MEIIAIVLAIAALMIAAERAFPAHRLPAVKGWWHRVILLNAAQAGVVFLAGITWERWFAGSSLVERAGGDLNSLGVAGAALVGYLVSSFVYYWWHRARHESAFLWRACHQVHHSVSRLEVVASFYKHPVELCCNSVLSTLIAYALLGLSPAAATALTLVTAVAELFYHWNMRTPRWVGFFIQRPEMHRIHHEKDSHRCNYADLPLIDMLFGTYHNPTRAQCECGFEPQHERRLGEMLLFRDVNHSAGRRPRYRRVLSWMRSRAARS